MTEKYRKNTLVALIGRPNVGKSTLFNRITGRRDAIVDATPGVTRDRHYAQVNREERNFILVDTGGLEEGGDVMNENIQAQALSALEEADVILFLLDARAGLMPDDFRISQMLRSSGRKVWYVVNKIDGPELEYELLAPFYELGVDQLLPLSSEHGYGFNNLMSLITADMPVDEEMEKLPDDTIRLAFIGRPNVGKSSIINKITGLERLVVSPQSGTTRDAIDITLKKDQWNYVLIDTAGIRRKGKTKEKLEKFSILKALGTLNRCDIAAVMIDADEGITEQDTKILGYVSEHGRGCMILLNKWDLIQDDHEKQQRLLDNVERAVNFMPHAPILKVSALTGRGIKRIFPMAGAIYRQFNARLNTSDLNRFLKDAVERHPPSMHRGRRLKFYYMAQISSSPPSFAIITNAPKGVHFSYHRYLLNQIRKGFGFDRTPVRLFFRERSGRKSSKQMHQK